MAANVTRPTAVDPKDFIAAVGHPTRRADAEVLDGLMRTVTGWSPQMWGPTIVGYGRYHYVGESGRAGDWMVTGFSPRAAHLVVYTMPGYDELAEMLGRLGKHRIGKSCLYINKLADVDLAVLGEIVTAGVMEMQRIYDTLPR